MIFDRESPGFDRPWKIENQRSKIGNFMLFFGRKKRLIDYASCAG
jgi:hypothetical protein